MGAIAVTMAAFANNAMFAMIRGNPAICLLIGALFLSFGLVNIYEKWRIFCAVVYIDGHIGPKLREMSEKDVLGWESYLDYLYRNDAFGRILIRLRYLIFVGPAVVLAGAYWQL